jgi:transcriptional regulator with XRE-family HTH domain
MLRHAHRPVVDPCPGGYHRLVAAFEAARKVRSPADGNGLGSRLREERLRQSIGVRELSRRLKISASMVSQIETGRVMPSVNTLYSITTALGITIDVLFESSDETASHRAEPSSAVDGLVQRAGDRRQLSMASGVTWELLTKAPDAEVEFIFATYNVGSESAPEGGLMRHGGRELGYVTKGRLGVTVGFETYELEAGDSIAFDSTVPHRLFNLDPAAPTCAVWFVVGRRDDLREPRD